MKHNHLDEFEKIHVRLGGFHQLMSFLGAGCKLFEGSGIEELWENIYAKNTKNDGKSLYKMYQSLVSYR